ncbi:MAG: helix-turn-helix domain-containing protein [Acidimicrobiia bacterium]
MPVGRGRTIRTMTLSTSTHDDGGSSVAGSTTGSSERARTRLGNERTERCGSGGAVDPTPASPMRRSGEPLEVWEVFDGVGSRFAFPARSSYFVEAFDQEPGSDSSQPPTEEALILQRRADARLVYSVTEAAAMLGISRAHGYDLVASGELPHLRLGRRVVIPKRVIEELLDVGQGGISLTARQDAERSHLPRLGR